MTNEYKVQVDYGSIVRNNLMKEKSYRPYCGQQICVYRWPRTTWTGEQFRCDCGWESTFPDSFIKEYKLKHHLK